MRTFQVMALVAMTTLSACAVSAEGPSFDTVSDAPPDLNTAKVYVFRDKVLYLAQAPYIARPQVTLDGSPIGDLKNGGFLSVNVSVGHHSLVIEPGPDQSRISFDLQGKSTAYLAVYDKTRMEGANAALAGAAFGAVGGVIYTLSANATTRNEGRVWHIEPLYPEDALPILHTLVRSD